MLAGAVHIQCGEDEINLSLKKSLAMIAVVALSSPSKVGRDKLAALLWSDKNQNAARAALRQTLHKLVRELRSRSQDILEITPDWIRLVHANVDLAHALAEARNGHVVPLLAENPNAFLDAAEDLDYVDPNFTNWISVQRQRMHEDAVAGLSDALERFSYTNRGGMEIARLILRMEPTHEVSCRYLMRAHYALGEMSEALSVYKKMWKVLDEEFDSSPSQETQNLVVNIKQDENDRTSVTQSVESSNGVQYGTIHRINNRLHQLPVLWVVPFDEAGLENENVLRALGMRTEFIGALCRFREWRVIDSPLGSKPPDDDQDMMVYTLLGSAAPHDDNAFKFVIDLREAKTCEVVWSESIFTDSVHWSRVQRRAIWRIASALRIHLSRNRLAGLGNVLDGHNSIHFSWLIGQALLTHWRVASEDRAEALFREVINNQPGFAPSLSGLAEILNTKHLIRPGLQRSRATHADALQLSLRAIELDPLDARAQLALAWSLSLNSEWDAAIQTFSVARNLNENDPWVLVSSALGFAYCGETSEANQLVAQMADLGIWVTPLHWAYNAGVRFIAQDYNGAVMAANLAIGSNAYVSAWRGAALANAGRTEEARGVLQTFYEDIRTQWYGEHSPTDKAINEWLLHCYPIRDHGDWLRFRDGLKAAGATVPESQPGISA